MNALEGPRPTAGGCAAARWAGLLRCSKAIGRCPLRPARRSVDAPSASSPGSLRRAHVRFGSAFLRAASEQSVSHTGLHCSLRQLTPQGREACDEEGLSSSLAANVTLPVIHAQSLLLARKDVFHAIFMRGSYFKLRHTNERCAPFICMSELMSVQNGSSSGCAAGDERDACGLSIPLSFMGFMQMDRLPTWQTTTEAALRVPQTAKVLSAVSTDQRQFCGSWVSRVTASLQNGKLGTTVAILLPDLSKGMRC